MKIRLAADLEFDSIVNGSGLRTVVWTQGCSHNCKGCHNQKTQDFKGGVEVSIEEVMEVFDEVEHQDGVTLSGGDPFFQVDACVELCHEFKKRGLNIWAYTGFTYEEVLSNKNLKPLLLELDVLIDGKFEEENKSFEVPFIGSSNQRIIDVKKSLEEDRVVLCDKYYKNKEVSLELDYLFI